MICSLQDFDDSDVSCRLFFRARRIRIYLEPQPIIQTNRTIRALLKSDGETAHEGKGLPFRYSTGNHYNKASRSQRNILNHTELQDRARSVSGTVQTNC